MMTQTSDLSNLEAEPGLKLEASLGYIACLKKIQLVLFAQHFLNQEIY